jgi:outer membrane lipoprotein SlyB
MDRAMMAVRLRHGTSLAAILLAVTVGLAGCAPTNTNTTYSSADIGRTAQLSYGVIISMRAVAVQNQNTGVGALGGAAIGGAAGSFIGRNDVRGNILGAVGGAVVGGLVGYAAENAVSTGQAIEFIIQEDNASAPISVVQTNEDNFRPGERVVLSRGSRTRIARAGI